MTDLRTYLATLTGLILFLNRLTDRQLIALAALLIKPDMSPESREWCARTLREVPND